MKLLTEEELYNHLIGLLPKVSGHTIAHIAKFIQSQEQAYADMVMGRRPLGIFNGSNDSEALKRIGAGDLWDEQRKRLHEGSEDAKSNISGI